MHKVQLVDKAQGKAYYLVDDMYEVVVHEKLAKEIFCQTCNSLTCHHATITRMELGGEIRNTVSN